MTLHLVAADVAPVWRGPSGAAHDDRVTEALVGEPVIVTGEGVGTRLPVLVPWQPSSLDEGGYPGWVEHHTIGQAVTDSPGLTVPPETFPPGLDDPVDLARSLLGTPYVWGGLSARGIDCSGLVHLVHRARGRVIPRDARDQAGALPAVPLDDVRRGDLYFFARPGCPVHHVGLVVEPGVLLHASDADGGVVEGGLDPDRTETLVSAARITSADLR